MEEEGDEDVKMNHVSKRSRHNKHVVVVFDNADRTEYLSGFRKRKDKRRQAAVQKKLHKDRQKRLQDRRERRAALRETKGDTQEGKDGGLTTDGAEDGEDAIAEPATKDVSGTATYEDTETTTVVRVTTLMDNEEEDGEIKSTTSHARSVSKSSFHGAKDNKFQPAKVKFKKLKKAQSEKRMRKLTRREKSVPKNLISRRDKKRKK